MSARQVRKRRVQRNVDLPIDIYGRISLDAENDEEGVRRQVKQCVQHLKQMGLKVGKTFIDNDTSAMYDERPQYEAMCERIKNGESGGVIGYHLKRILRRVLDMENLIDLVEATGARVITIMSSELDLNNASGRAIGRILAAMGQMEVEELSERLQAYFYDRAAQGKPHGRGRRPFGYNDDWRTLHVGGCDAKCEEGCKGNHPNESEAYRELFDLVIKGHTLSQIAEMWEARGLVDRKGNRYSVSNLRAKVVFPRARGAVMHHGTVLEGVVGDWDPIVSPATQMAAINALATRRTHLRRTGPTYRPVRLLSGLLRCGGCDGALYVRRSGGELVYACNKSSQRGCGKVTVAAEHLEREVEKRFLGVLTDPKVHRKLEKARRQQPDTQALVEEVNHLQLDLAKADADLGDGEITRARWQNITKGIQRRLDDATARLEKASNGPNLLTIDPAQTVKQWKKLDLDEQRRRLAAWIEGVRVMPLNGTGGRNFRPERVATDWRL